MKNKELDEVIVQLIESKEGYGLINDAQEVAQKKFMADSQSVKRLNKYFMKKIMLLDCENCACKGFCKVHFGSGKSSITLCDLVMLLYGRDLHNADKNLDKE